MGLCSESYADGGVASVMAVQAHTAVTVSTATNACEDALP